MGKKQKAPQPDTDSKPDIAVIFLESAHQKAANIVAEHFGPDHLAVAEENWFEVAGQLPANVPWRLHNAIVFLCSFEGFFYSIDGDPEHLSDALYYAFELGRTSAYVELEADIPAGVDGAIKSYRAHQKASRKGGKATKRLTLAQEKLALKLIEEKLTPGVSKTAACQRAVRDLLEDHGIQVSGKTLSRLWNKKQDGQQ